MEEQVNIPALPYKTMPRKVWEPSSICCKTGIANRRFLEYRNDETEIYLTAEEESLFLELT